MTDKIEVDALKQVEFPSASATTKPRKKPKRRATTEDRIRMLGAISRGEV